MIMKRKPLKSVRTGGGETVFWSGKLGNEYCSGILGTDSTRDLMGAGTQCFPGKHRAQRR